jgi:hypothetical protein
LDESIYQSGTADSKTQAMMPGREQNATLFEPAQAKTEGNMGENESF